MAAQQRTALTAARLGVVVFACGAASLSTEIAASRLLAPFFGSSTIVWANIIGLILIYLSVGYWLGGRVADRHPSPRPLGMVILGAAVVIAILPYAAKPILRAALVAFTAVSVGATVGSFFATMVLFAIPVTLLGMVSPFAIRLALPEVSSAGTVAGRLYGLSTIGSIVGTFLPALVTIPLIGTQRTLLATALAVALAAILLLGRRALLPAVLISALLAVPTGSVKEQPGLITETESPYQFVQVLSHPDGARDLEINEGRTSHSVWRSSEVLTGGEWDMFLIVPALLHRPVQHILIIGNAGGTTARALGHFYPQADVDGVELDPTVTDLGRRWLGLGDNPRLRVHDADGRPFLEVSKQRWDLIFVDAYRQPYIPFQLATSEFFALVRDHLQPDGLLALNVERIPGDEALARTVESTVATAFASVWRWPALRFSELVVAGSAIAKDGPQLGPVDHRLQSLSDLFNRDAVPADRSSHPMSDDRAPIEWLTDRTILEYIVSGRQMDEQLLPTWPGWNGKGG